MRIKSIKPARLVSALAVGLVAVVLGLGSFLRPKRPPPEKLIAYESGVDPVGTGWTQSEIRYYIFALLFVMFDVEAVFIFPWATRLEVYGMFGLVEMAINSDVNTLPSDSTASIVTAGLLGEKYIGISVGGDDLVLRDGDEIHDTQSALVLEELIGRFLLNTVSKDD